MTENLASGGTICYNWNCLAYRNGAFFFSNADDLSKDFVDKAPFISGLSSRCMLDTSAANEGRFVMTAGDGKPCRRCGTSEWYRGNCKQCKKNNAREWGRNNPEKSREKRRRWSLENPEKERERSLRWQKNNPGEGRRRVLSWQKNNPEKVAAKYHRRRTRKTKAGGSYTAAEWKAVVKQQGGRCLACGKKKKLTADHVVPVIAGGSSDISNIQGLCRPCNSSKKDKTIDYRTKPGIKRWVQERLL